MFVCVCYLCVCIYLPECSFVIEFVCVCVCWGSEYENVKRHPCHLVRFVALNIRILSHTQASVHTNTHTHQKSLSVKLHLPHTCANSQSHRENEQASMREFTHTHTHTLTHGGVFILANSDLSLARAGCE